MKKKYFLTNNATLQVSEEYIDENSEYFVYSTPWRFNNELEAKDYLRENLKRRIKQIDKKINELNSEREELVNKMFNI